MEPTFPRNLGTAIMTIPTPGSHVVHPHGAALESAGVLAQGGPAIFPRRGQPFLPAPLLVPKNPQDPLPSLCARPWLPGHTLPTGSWPPGQAQVGSYEVQTFVPTCSSGNKGEPSKLTDWIIRQRAQTLQQLGQGILSPAGLYPDSPHELPAVVPASPGSRHLAMWYVCQEL